MWHAGEKAFQRFYGIEERMAEIGSRVIRDFMPEQHREFFRMIPFIVAGAADQEGQPWASLLTGSPGFISSPDATSLTIAAIPAEDDPLHGLLRDGRAIGLLGIQQHTKRRNRANGLITKAAGGKIDITVKESFGNCPRYITERDTEWLAHEPTLVRDAAGLSEDDRHLIRAADTLFLATTDGKDGIDASHRGGPAGFVAVEGDVLLLPNYPGNNFFNSLGNLLLHPKAGLLFIDFATGQRLHIAADAEILQDGEEIKLRLTVTRAIRRN